MKRPRLDSLAQCAAVALLGAALLLAPHVSHAQDSYAAYDSLALRVKVGFWGVKLVAGHEETKIAGLGSFPSREPADLMKARSPEAANLYLNYRTHQQIGSTFVWLGFAAWVGSFFALAEDTPSGDDLAQGLFWGGFASVLIGSIVNNQGIDSLHKAIWTYNRTLVEPAQTFAEPVQTSP